MGTLRFAHPTAWIGARSSLPPPRRLPTALGSRTAPFPADRRARPPVWVIVRGLREVMIFPSITTPRSTHGAPAWTRSSLIGVIARQRPVTDDVRGCQHPAGGAHGGDHFTFRVHVFRERDHGGDTPHERVMRWRSKEPVLGWKVVRWHRGLADLEPRPHSIRTLEKPPWKTNLVRKPSDAVWSTSRPSALSWPGFGRPWG
jgi:hypothetical protein